MNLKDWFRTHPEVKQGDMAKSLSITPAYLSFISNSKRRPSPDVAAAIERATGGAVTRLELLYGNDTPASALSGASLTTDRP